LTAHQPASGITSPCQTNTTYSSVNPTKLRRKGATSRNAAKLALTSLRSSNLEFIMSQLSGVPTRKQLARYSSLIMVGTACLVQILAFLLR